MSIDLKNYIVNVCRHHNKNLICMFGLVVSASAAFNYFDNIGRIFIFVIGMVVVFYTFGEKRHVSKISVPWIIIEWDRIKGEVDTRIFEMKRLILMQSEISARSIVYFDRAYKKWDIKDRDEKLKEIKLLVSELDSENMAINILISEWHMFILKAYAKQIYKIISEKKEKSPVSFEIVLKCLSGKYMNDEDSSVESIRRICFENNIEISGDLHSWIEDYEYYEKNKQHRRQEVFLSVVDEV